MRSTAITPILIIAISLSVCLQACWGPKIPDNTQIVVTGDMLPAIVTVRSENDDARDRNELEIFMLPEGRLISQVPLDELQSIWSDGMLIMRDGSVEWLDLDRETGEYVPNPAYQLTSWETPVAVNSDENILYAFAHTVPPGREIHAYYGDGRESERVGQLAADEIEVLDELPSNGWPVFYVDRPGQAGAVMVDQSSTRKMRVYGGSYLAGEYPDVLDIFFLEKDVVLNRETEGWIFCEITYPLISSRTMSLDTIPGDPRPLARDGDVILFASYEEAECCPGETESILFAYGVYTRTLEEIWNPSQWGDPLRILSMAVVGPGDYYIVTDRQTLPGLFDIWRFREGTATEVANGRGATESSEVRIYLLDEGTGGIGELPETVDISAGNTEGIS